MKFNKILLVTLLLLSSMVILMLRYYKHNGDVYPWTTSEKHNVEYLKKSEIPTFEDIKNLPMDHPLLLQYLLKRLKPPSNLQYPKDILDGDPSKFTDIIAKMFKGKKGGFFIECGANDGYFRSNTLALERDFGWSGVLIEAHPDLNVKLVTRNRKAWVADVCLSPFSNVSEIEFLVSAKHEYEWEQGIAKVAIKDDILFSKFDPKRKIFKYKSYGMVRCFPIFSIMQALNVTYADYFSLDVQGIEAKILKTLPFDERLIIDVLHVEYELDPEGKQWMKSFVESKGYKLMYERDVNYIFKRVINNKTNS